MLKFRSIIAITLLLAGVLTISNPGHDRHMQAFREAVRKEVPLTGLFHLDTLVSKFQTYHSAILFSWTEVEKEVVTYGFLGSVWVDEQALKQGNRR